MNGGGELWKQCVEWLVTIGALPPSHKARLGGVVFDLAQTLRDGVVLCNVLNFIQPGVVDESQINLRAQMSEFLCMQNIRVVIYSMQSFFGIPQTELFTAQDLYQMTNFGKVLQCLSYLSSLPIIATRVKPFRQSRRGSRVRGSTEDEDIYSNLPDLAVERSLADEDDNLYDSVPEEKEEGIYGSLIDVKKSAPTVSMKDKRGCCIHEIVETENNYVQHLQMMVNQFMQPLRQNLQDKDIRVIFMNIEQLLPIHVKFRDELEKLQRAGSNAKMSQPFLHYKDKFLIYGEYCSNLVDAQDYLEEMMKANESIRIKIEECQINSSRNKFKLRELLCVPMQRILKYHLLIKELNKHTTESHADKPNMPKALTSMQELSQYINEVKRDSEELIKINQIESSLEGYDAGIPLRTYGRVRKDGELKVKIADDKNQSLRNAFLFDKALFTTKLKNDTYYLKDLMRLEGMKLEENLPSSNSKNKWSWGWGLSSTRQGVKSCTLYAKTDSERMKWLEAFKDAFDNISPRGLKGKKHNFEMQTFSEPTKCNSCEMLLKGIFYQGYQCTVTSARCHKSCLADTLKLIENNSIGMPVGGPNKEKPPPVPGRGKKRTNVSIKPANPTPEVSLNYKAHRDYSGVPAPPFPSAAFITFRIGEPIEVIEQVTPDWWKGKSFADYNNVGFFPASYVSPVKSNCENESPLSLDVLVQSQRAPRQSQYVDNPVISPNNSSGQGLPQSFGSLNIEPMEDSLWYAGEIDRPEAEKLLWDKPSGTFLIREKKVPHGFVISLKFNRDIKHIKILQTSDNLHYVAECKNFRSVQDLIKFYQSNSLSGFFLGLETTLRYPYRDPDMFPGMPFPQRPKPPIDFNPPARPESMRSPSQANSNGWANETTGPDGRLYGIIGHARALYDFTPRSYQELPLRAGQEVNIVSKAGGDHGWWKGEYNGQIGYFPTTFVEEDP